MKSTELYENVNVVPAGIFATLTAGGAGDATEVTGAVIDTLDNLSAVLAVYTRATIAASKKLSLTIKVGESADGSTFDADETLATAVTVQSGVTTNAEVVYELKIDLSALKARKRFLRFKVTPDLDAASTDTATIAAQVLLGGARVKPIAH